MSLSTDFLKVKETLFTDPTDPRWTMAKVAGKTMVFHACDTGFHNRLGIPSEDACRWCYENPPPGFIALYKLYTWDEHAS